MRVAAVMPAARRRSRGNCSRCARRARRTAARRRTASGAARSRSSRASGRPASSPTTLRSPVTTESGQRRDGQTRRAPARADRDSGGSYRRRGREFRRGRAPRAPVFASSSRRATDASGSGRPLVRAAVAQARPDERLAMHDEAGWPARRPWPALTSATSSSSFSSRSSSSSLDTQVTSTSTFGWLAAKRARISGRNCAGISRPACRAGSCPRSAARGSAAAPRRQASGCAGRSRPAPRRPASGSTERPSLAKSGRPTCSSSFFICMETADGVRKTARAARLKLPVSAIATRVRRRSSSSPAPPRKSRRLGSRLVLADSMTRRSLLASCNRSTSSDHIDKINSLD